MDSNSKHINRSSANVEDSELLGTKIQNEQLNSLMESNNDIKKSLQDLKDLVMWQNQNKFQNVQDIGNTTNIDNALLMCSVLNNPKRKLRWKTKVKKFKD